MIRVAIFLAAVGVFALGVGWFADRPGDVAITWLGWQIETSVMLAAFVLLFLIAAAIALWSLVRGILRSPDQLAGFLRNRRAIKGYRAISRGLIAVGAGDAVLARKSASDAERLAPEEPLALLLAAQSAQLSGERVAAERAFRSMTRRTDTKLIGLRGLYMEARRRNDPAAAQLFAEEAARASPGLTWANQAALDFRCANGDWAGALATLENMQGTLSAENYRRQRAVLLTARASSLEEGDRDTARELALEAVKLTPDLVPAAALAGRLLAEQGSQRKAAKVLEAAWKANPHPDLADAYAHLRIADSARERLTRIHRLIEKGPRGLESALALAQAALEARQFNIARAALSDYLAAPTQRVAMLMAELDESEHGDAGRARQWMARAVHALRDPAWTADGFVSDRWMPVSPVSGRLDAFQWKVPLEEIGIKHPVIEAEPGPDREAPVVKPELTPPRAAPAPKELRPVETVIPLVHAPDDPGPDSRLESDPVPEPTTLPPDQWRDNWRRIREFFR